MALVLLGAVMSLDDEIGDRRDAAVYIGDDGLIEAVAAESDTEPAGYENAPHLPTDGVISPGLIDLHNHLAYNFRPLWVPPRAEPYTRRDQWPGEQAYTLEIRDPANAMGAAAGMAVLKFAEVKAVVGGVTAIQGSARGNRPYEGWLVRNVEYETFGTGDRTVFQSVRTLGSSDYEGVRQHLADGAAFIYHLAEGTSPALLDDYSDLRENDCLAPGLAAIHATALQDSQFEEWGPKGGSVVWSPFSNVWLYRDTTDVVAARDSGLTVCLGSDWAPSGTKNLVGELKVADLWNREHFDGAFSDRELVKMVTQNPAKAVGWTNRLGRVAPGLLADLVVTLRRDDEHPDRNLIDSTELDVHLTVVAGRPVYGTGELMRDGEVASTEPIYVAGARRTIQLLDPGVPDADMSWAEVMQTLELARTDPGVARSLSAARDLGAEPFRLIPDMPGDDLSDARAADAMATVIMPPLDTLFHDAEFFRTVEAAPIANGLLDGLRDGFDHD
jgi:cytosine/adenosine deaminase-related metal-dependent hydrolase